jgi:hypothetical protein
MVLQWCCNGVDEFVSQHFVLRLYVYTCTLCVPMHANKAFVFTDCARFCNGLFLSILELTFSAHKRNNYIHYYYYY